MKLFNKKGMNAGRPGGIDGLCVTVYSGYIQYGCCAIRLFRLMYNMWKTMWKSG